MKKLTTLLIAVFISAVQFVRAQSASVASQSVHPTSLPEVLSEDNLRNKALSMPSHGSRYVVSDSMDYSYTNTVVFAATNGAYVEQLMNRMFAVPFSYRIANSNDLVNSYCYVYDDDCNDLLFYGSGNAIAKTLNGTNKLFTQFDLQNVPILSDVKSAEVLVLNQDGTTATQYPLTVNQCGKALMQGWMTHYTNAILAATFNNGDLVTYPMGAPGATAPGVVLGNGGYGITGHYQITSSVTNDVTLKIIEVWNLPTAFLDFSNYVTVTMDVMGVIQNGNQISFERPLSVDVSSPGYPTVTVQLSQAQATPVSFSPGQYRLKFNWAHFMKPGFWYTGGKG